MDQMIMAVMPLMNMATQILIIGIINQMKWVMVETITIITRMVEEGADTEVGDVFEVDFDHVDAGEEEAEAEDVE